MLLPAEIRLLIQKQLILEYRHLTNTIYPAWKRSDAQICYISPEMSNGKRGWVLYEKPSCCTLLTYSTDVLEEDLVCLGYIYTVSEVLCKKGYP